MSKGGAMKRRDDRWADAAQAWAALDDPTARLILTMRDGIPDLVVRAGGREVRIYASPTWETVAELMIRAADALARERRRGLA